MENSSSGKSNGTPDHDPGVLLERFLHEAKMARTAHGQDSAEKSPEPAGTWPSYQEPPITDATREKIERLRSVADSLERRHSPPPPKPVKLDREYKIDYLASLNESQFLAATHRDGPILVIAGAGTGKTRVIVYRVAYLIENGLSPESILLLTFTRKAAREMLGRVQQLLGDDRAAKATGGTFHGFASRVLRQYAPLLGLSADFSIIDSADAEDTIDLIRTELKFHKNQKAFPRKGRLYEIISSARNRDLPIAAVIEADFSGLQHYTGDIELITSGYKSYKTICNLLDYDDLLETFRVSLRDRDGFRRKLQDLYPWIMVDEFQDTNTVQRDIIDLLAKKHRNVMAVGDDAQSIYAFRGANYENILRFPETYPDCRVVKIEHNYRSHQALLDFSNRIIEQATLGFRKALFSPRHASIKPVISRFYDQAEEAAYVVDKVLELREKGIGLREVAVLYRSSWHARFIETELLKRNIPYVVVGGLKFNERRHIKDVMAYLRVIHNPRDEVAWHRILNLVPGIGKTTASRITASIRNCGNMSAWSEFDGKNYRPELRKLQRLMAAAEGIPGSVDQIIKAVIEYYHPLLMEMESDHEVRMGDISVFQSLAKRYKSLEAFLTDFALEPPSRYFQNQTSPLIDESEDSPLTLSTVHSAKGLEWHSVFIPHALDGLFPSARALGSFEELEEELRLFYVACSRAKEQLFISLPSSVQSFSAFFSYPSRFIRRIDPAWYQGQPGR